MRGGIRSKKVALEVVSLLSLTVFMQRLGKSWSVLFLVAPKMCMYILGKVSRSWQT